MGRSASRHRVERVAAGIRQAAAEQGVELPVSYARRVTAEGLALGAELVLTRLGSGVVIHTAPEVKDHVPVVVGYADARGQWHRDGRRYVEGLVTEGPGEAVGVGP